MTRPGSQRTAPPAPATRNDSLTLAASRPARPLRELVLHLAQREIAATHRSTVLGWAWPITRQLAQLAVLVVVFSKILDLGIENYPVFVFSGLVAWNWFSSGVGGATTSLLTHRHLLLQPRSPTLALPIVAVAVPLLDVLVALPILGAMVAATTGLRWTVVLLPVALVVQLLLMCGLAWGAAAATVFFRDIPNVVLVGLTLLFYLTPVFYGLRSVPDGYEWLLKLNPLTTIIEFHRALLLDSAMPNAVELAAVALGGALVAALGYVAFRRVERRFVDFV